MGWSDSCKPSPWSAAADDMQPWSFSTNIASPWCKPNKRRIRKRERRAKSSPDSNAANNTLLNTNDELYLRGKGGFVFWMLRDMVGDETMQRAIAAYRGGADKDPSYFQRLVQTSPKRDLEWFFDDWVYRDRGLRLADPSSGSIATQRGASGSRVSGNATSSERTAATGALRNAARMISSATTSISFC